MQSYQRFQHIGRMAFNTSGINAATFVSRDCGGYTLAFANRIAHSGSHGETRAFPPLATARSCAASEIATIRTAGGSGCTPMACVRFLRRRGPAGLRDLFRFCRNCGLYALRSGPFRVCEARGGITTLSALYVLLKRWTAACQSGYHVIIGGRPLSRLAKKEVDIRTGICLLSDLLAASSILCCLRTASPQGIAALAAQGGVATLAERSDETFTVGQFSSADRE